MKEIWKDIPGYDGWYQVSTFGRVRSWRKHAGSPGKRLKPRILKQPSFVDSEYLRVTLTKNGSQVTKRAHVLVAESFIPNPENKPYVNHIDGNKRNNLPENLEWCTHSDNMKHSFRTGLQVALKGQDSPTSVLTDKDVLDIRSAYDLGCFYHKEIAEAFNISRCHVTDIINRKKWAHI